MSILKLHVKKNDLNDIWLDSPFGAIKKLSTTARGQIGEQFVYELFEKYGFSPEYPLTADEKKAYTHPWDISVEDITFEVKIATLSTSNVFQFNRITLTADYMCLLLIGVSPTGLFIKGWTKSQVVTKKAGTLTAMEPDTNNSFKLIKKPTDLYTIEKFADAVTEVMSQYENEN